MSWGAVAAIGVSAVSKYLGDKSAKKQEKRGWDQKKEEIALQREGLDFSKDQYGDWKEKYDPVFADMMSEIDSGITPDYAAIAGDVNSSFESAQGQERRSMQRYGIKPTDGAAKQSEREYGIKKSTAHSGIRNQARQASAGIKYNRLANIHGALQGSGVALGSNVGNSYGRTANSMGQMADMRMKSAGQRRDEATSDAAGYGAMVGAVDWGGAWGAVKGWSDAALKENLQLLEVSSGMNVYKWDWNETAKDLGIDGPTTGLLAQEHLDSGFVHEAENGYLYIDYPGLLKSRSVM
jgi:hypothetical protein